MPLLQSALLTTLHLMPPCWVNRKTIASSSAARKEIPLRGRERIAVSKFTSKLFPLRIHLRKIYQFAPIYRQTKPRKPRHKHTERMGFGHSLDGRTYVKKWVESLHIFTFQLHWSVWDLQTQREKLKSDKQTPWSPFTFGRTLVYRKWCSTAKSTAPR